MTSRMKSGFGAKLRILRKRRNQTQAAMTKEIKVMFPQIQLGQTHISILEHQQNAPRQEVLDMLSAYFNVPIIYWYEEEKEGLSKDVEVCVSGITRVLRLMEYAPSSMVSARELRLEMRLEVDRMLDELELYFDSIEPSLDKIRVQFEAIANDDK